MTSQFSKFLVFFRNLILSIHCTHLSRRCSCCLDGQPPFFLGQKALLCFSHTRLGRFFPALDMTAAAFVAFVAVVAAAEVGGSAVAAVGRPWPAALAK